MRCTASNSTLYLCTLLVLLFIIYELWPGSLHSIDFARGPVKNLSAPLRSPQSLSLLSSASSALPTAIFASASASPSRTSTLPPQNDFTQFALRNYWSSKDGNFMPGHNKLVSLNHEFELTVEPTSELRIYSHRRGTKKMIFWTNNDAHWIGEKWAGFNQQGFFSTFHREKPEDKDPYMTWSTFMWPECRKSPTKDQIPLVLLSDVGALKVLHVPENKIASLNDFISDEGEWANYVVCTPYAGDPEKLREVGQEDMGRLAVLFTGSLRSYKKTCHSQKNMIFDKWPGSKGVDIFFAVLENDVWEGDQVVQKVNWNEVEKDLRTCFGSRFKVLEHVPPPKTSFPGTNDTGSCLSDPRRPPELYYHQLSHMERGRKMIMAYSIRNGIQYDYVLKMRPDHFVWGDQIPPFEPVEHDTIVYPIQYWDETTWTTSHTGQMQMTPSDQVAFGRLAPMTIYLSLYNSWPELVKIPHEKPTVDFQKMGLRRDEVPPWSSPPSKKLTWPFKWWHCCPCFIEGYMSYWPTLNGLRIRFDWRWKINLLRRNGKYAISWHLPYNASQGTRYVTNGFE